MGALFANCAGLQGKQVWHSMAETLPEEASPETLPTERIAFRHAFFEVTVPEHIKVEAELRADFYRYSFTHEESGDEFMFAFDAAFPPFPAIGPEEIRIRKIRINELDARSIDWMSDRGYCREVLITLAERPNWPPYLVHFMYQDLDDTQRLVADNIIATVLQKNRNAR